VRFKIDNMQFGYIVGKGTTDATSTWRRKKTGWYPSTFEDQEASSVGGGMVGTQELGCETVDEWLVAVINAML